MEIDWNTIWSAVTAISTLIMTLATITMAVFAGSALNSWKKEIKLKKIYRINKNYIKTIDEFLKLLHNYELMPCLSAFSTRPAGGWWWRSAACCCGIGYQSHGIPVPAHSRCHAPCRSRQ